jgi:putative DNA primase/helicase
MAYTNRQEYAAFKCQHDTCNQEGREIRQLDQFLKQELPGYTPPADGRREATEVFEPVTPIPSVPEDATLLVAPDATRRFNLAPVDLASIEASVQPTEWLIQDYLIANEIGVLYGPSMAFKSFVVLDWALCIATGTPWQGHFTRKATVVYIAGEGAAGLNKRLAAWVKQHPDADIDNAQFWMSRVAADLYTPEGQREAYEAIRELCELHGTTPDFIIIDTLSRNAAGAEENSNSDLSLVLANAERALRDPFQASVLFVHHTGKDVAKGARGAYVLTGNVDIQYEVRRPVADLPCSELVCKKLKDNIEPESLHLAAESVELSIMENNGQPVTSLVMARASDELVAQLEQEQHPAQGGMGAGMQRLWSDIQRNIQAGMTLPLDEFRDMVRGNGHNNLKRTLVALSNRGLIRYSEEDETLTRPPVEEVDPHELLA